MTVTATPAAKAAATRKGKRELAAAVNALHGKDVTVTRDVIDLQWASIHAHNAMRAVRITTSEMGEEVMNDAYRIAKAVYIRFTELAQHGRLSEEAQRIAEYELEMIALRIHGERIIEEVRADSLRCSECNYRAGDAEGLRVHELDHGAEVTAEDIADPEDIALNAAHCLVADISAGRALFEEMPGRAVFEAYAYAGHHQRMVPFLHAVVNAYIQGRDDAFEDTRHLLVADRLAWVVAQMPDGAEGLYRIANAFRGLIEAAQAEGRKAAEDKAIDHDRKAAESFDRCDTDGFLTQWSHGILAGEARLQARIDANGGVLGFPALFDLNGNLVAAKLISGNYGLVWGVLESDDPRSRVVQWVNRSNASTAVARNRNLAKKGFTEGRVLAPCRATLAGGGTGLAGAMNVTAIAQRTDGGFSRDVTVLHTIDIAD